MAGQGRAAVFAALAALLLAVRRSEAGPLGSAISLESTDGQRLDFLRLTVSAALIGPFAFVENELVFQNPQPRRMEGRFSFALPTGPLGTATPSRFAMEIQGSLMEGEVVDRQRARRVYRDILHEARDPALLEQGPGNIFTARVFPIEPRAVVRLLLSYSLTLPLRSSQRALVLPLRGLPRIEGFRFSAVVGSLGNTVFNASCSAPQVGNITGSDDGGGLVRFEANVPDGLTPDADVVLQVQESPSAGAAISVDGGQLVSLFTVGSAAPAPAAPNFSPPTWIVYVDTSASTADTAVVRVPLIEALLDAMPAVDVEVWAFDIEVVQLRGRRAKDATLGADVRTAIEGRLPLGATDLELLLQHLNARTQAAAGGLGVLVLTDAIPTASERASARLAALLADSPNRVLELGVIGSKLDSAVATALAAAGNGRVVQIPLTSRDLPSVAAAAWGDLTRPLGGRASPSVSSGWVWPEAVCDLHEGDEVVVFSGGSGGLTVPRPELQIVKDGATTTVTPSATQAAAAAFSALLSREATQARLQVLEVNRQLAVNATEADSLQSEIVALSERSRILTPHTALLVLETEEDYVRFGISRDQLSPILVVAGAGVELRQRDQITLPALPTTVTLTTTTGETTTMTTTATPSCNCSDDPRGDSPEPAPAPPGANDAGMPQMARATGKACGSHPSCLVAVLTALSVLWGVHFVGPAIGSQGVSGSSFGSSAGGGRRLNTWANIEEGARNTVAQHGAAGPTERRRDLASAYAGALWTLRRAQDLRTFCKRWLTWDPSNTLVFEYLSKAAQQLNDDSMALRAATSIAEIAPRDPEQLLRGAWIAITLRSPSAPSWARRLAERSLEERSDNPNVYRALALASWREGNYEAAAQAYAQGIGTQFNSRYGDVGRVLEEEAAIFLRTLEAQNQTQATMLHQSVLRVDKNFGKDISLLISMSWLTDANDVDLHVVEPNGEECYYANRQTTHLELYSDQTQGLGPEVVALRGRPQAGLYRVGVKYYSAGAMGASRGAVVIRQLSGGVLVGEARVEVFTLPAGYNDVLPIADVTLT